MCEGQQTNAEKQGHKVKQQEQTLMNKIEKDDSSNHCCDTLTFYCCYYLWRPIKLQFLDYYDKREFKKESTRFELEKHRYYLVNRLKILVTDRLVKAKAAYQEQLVITDEARTQSLLIIERITKNMRSVFYLNPRNKNKPFLLDLDEFDKRISVQEDFKLRLGELETASLERKKQRYLFLQETCTKTLSSYNDDEDALLQNEDIDVMHVFADVVSTDSKENAKYRKAVEELQNRFERAINKLENGSNNPMVTDPPEEKYKRAVNNLTDTVRKREFISDMCRNLGVQVDGYEEVEEEEEEEEENKLSHEIKVIGVETDVSHILQSVSI